jgi:hypothetical protein
MKRIRLPRSRSVVHRGRVKLAAVAAGLLALGALAVPAIAEHGHHGDGSGARQHGPNAAQQRPGGEQSGKPRPGASRDPIVNFRRNALFSCFGADATGIPTADTANITASFATVTAVVTVHAPPGTRVFGQLTQSGCVRLKFFTFTIGLGGVGTTTVSDLRVSNDAFAWFVTSAGGFEVSPEVLLFPGVGTSGGRD